MKKRWDTIKKVINKKRAKSNKNLKFMLNGKLVEDNDVISDSFNEFFVNVGNELDKKIEKVLTTKELKKWVKYKKNIKKR